MMMRIGLAPSARLKQKEGKLQRQLSKYADVQPRMPARWKRNTIQYAMVLLAHAKYAPCPYHQRSATLAKRESVRSAILGTRASRDPRILNVVSAAITASLMILMKVLTQMTMLDVRVSSIQHQTHMGAWWFSGWFSNSDMQNKEREGCLCV